MIKGKSITLAIPCKNEEQAIASLLKKVPKFIDQVLVIDNNSTDRTREVAEKFGAKVLTEKREAAGIGYGFAHLRAIKESRTDYLVTLDGDNTYPLSAIIKLVELAEKHNLHFISGSRFPLKKAEALSKIRQFGVWLLNMEVKLLYHYPMQDILSGMWLMDRTARKKLNLSRGGWNLSPEIKLAALNNPEIGFREYHIAHHVRAGDSKQLIWKTGVSHLGYIFYRRLVIDFPYMNLLSLKQNLPARLWSFEN